MDKKISELNNVTLPLDGSEVVPIVQNGETKKINASEFGGGGVVDNTSITEFVSGTYNIDWSVASNWDLTITGNTTITQSNEPLADTEKTITIYVVGDFALTLPADWEVKNNGFYDGVNGSQIVVQCWNFSKFYTVIN